ncbi:MAG: DUF4920 domain-containing protein [Ginsengibacter sp.]
MKKIFLIVLVFISSFTYAQVKPAAKGSVYGSQVSNSNAITAQELEKKLNQESEFTGNLQGKVVSVCQEKGCWMKIAKADGETIMIRFKDYKFFVPKNIDGKEVVLSGVAKKSVTSVETLKHYAKDAGKPDDEIAKITEPKNEIVFTASGLRVL